MSMALNPGGINYSKVKLSLINSFNGGLLLNADDDRFS